MFNANQVWKIKYRLFILMFQIKFEIYLNIIYLAESKIIYYI